MEDQQTDGITIASLEVSNYKRVTAASITPKNNIIMISGGNGDGKSSALDGMWAALGGGKASKETTEPIHRGATKAHVIVDLGDMIVTRKWSTKGGSKLEVVAKDGTTLSSPQNVLDELVGRYAFDPLAFAQLSPKEQTTALQEIVTLEIDLDEIAAQRQAAFELRTVANRETKTLAAQLKCLGVIDTTVPDEEVSSADILSEIEAAQATVASNKEQRKALEDFHVEAAELQSMIAVKQAQLEKMIEQGKQMRANIDALVDPPIGELREKLANVEETNRAVRAYKEHSGIQALLKEHEDKSLALTDQMEDLDKTRSDGLKKAVFPIDGLSFGDDGVTYNDFPFTQASEAERLKVSFAIAMALNPQLKVIRIRSGNQLDSNSLALIEELAKANGFQVWIEWVDITGKIGVVIKDGVVVADNQ